MALAKFHEENLERLIASTSDQYEAAIGDLFHFLPRRALPAGEVHLLRNGRRMEDVEICDVGDKLEVTIETSGGSAPVEVELLDRSGGKVIEPRADGHYAIPFKSAGPLTIQVRSGGFLKNYQIEAIEPKRVASIPALATLIQSLSENPPEWTPDTFREFRSQLELILEPFPQTFADGIVEYHMALFLEEQRNTGFRERLQSAYGHLRWFIPASDIARLICSYYLFCTNDFDAAEKLWRSRSGRLRQAISLFTGREGKGSAGSGKATSEALALLVAMPDLILFQAIEALQGGRPGDAMELIRVARRHIHADFDRERTARCAFIEACAQEASMKAPPASDLFESLLDCPWETVASAASRHHNALNAKS